MPYVAIQETVADFPGWKPVSHARGTARKTSGAEGARRFRDADDPGEIFFNDPVLVDDAPERAVRMAVAMRDRVAALTGRWRKRGHDLALGVGIAQGYATIGAIGFEGRWDYGAIGTVTNLAARLCGEAQPGQILLSARVASGVEDLVEAEEVGVLALKGFARRSPPSTSCD